MTDEQHEKREEPAAEPPAQTRRELLDTIAIGGGVLLGASAVYPVVSFLSAPSPSLGGAAEVAAGKASELIAGQAIAFRFGNKPALLVRDHGGHLRAFIALCTHLDCVVQFRAETSSIWCACHNGLYDLAGRNVQGPPPRPLTPLLVEVRGDDVFVRKA
ncbi:Rieske 2Fe-2S domain-containing protein [Myxococcota bacterium]|nr:Rieske 2Fe-2S domain-containing protein [Myxococcota bacterium]